MDKYLMFQGLSVVSFSHAMISPRRGIRPDILTSSSITRHVGIPTELSDRHLTGEKAVSPAFLLTLARPVV